MGLGSFVSGLFGGGGGGTTVNPRRDFAFDSSQDLYNFATNQRKKRPYDPGAPYPGQLSAPMSANETSSQNRLSNYITSPIQSNLTNAADFNNKLIAGNYDPRVSPYYKAMKDQILRDADDAKARILHSSAVSGHLHSDPRRIQERELAENTTGQLATLIGSLYENELDRQQQASNDAVNIANALDKSEAGRITLGSTYGGLPRQIDQSMLDREYGEYNRQQAGLRYPYDLLETLAGGNGYDPYPNQPVRVGGMGGSDFGDIANIGLQLLPYFL